MYILEDEQGRFFGTFTTKSEVAAIMKKHGYRRCPPSEGRADWWRPSDYKAFNVIKLRKRIILYGETKP
jgi:hypothetical protein